MAIAFGVSLLLLCMLLVMGIPFVYYLKRDLAYNSTKDQPDDVQLKVWYNQ